MAAQFRIDQVTPGAGTPDVARFDLVPGEIISLVATSPAPGPGVTFTWELLDVLGTTAALSATTGQSVSIGPALDIVSPCAFRIKLTTFDGITLSESIRVCGVRTTLAGLRYLLFGEQAPPSATLDANNPALSEDNSVYPDLAGRGSSGQNWADWREWAREIVDAVETGGGGGGGPNVGIKFHLRAGGAPEDNPTVPPDFQYIVKSPAPIIDAGASLTLSPGAQLVVIP